MKILDVTALLVGTCALVVASADQMVRPATLPMPPVRRVSSIYEMIVSASLGQRIPPDLSIELAWEESRFDPLAERLESNGTWSTGIFQINRGREHVHDLNVSRQISDGVAIAAYWWALTHDRKRTIRAYRRGRL